MKKDWKNLSDKELDEEFRRASGHQDIPFRPGDWELMQAKLDSSAFFFPFHQVWMWGVLLGLLLLVGLHMAEPVQTIQNELSVSNLVEPMASSSPDFLIQEEPRAEQNSETFEESAIQTAPASSRTHVEAIPSFSQAITVMPETDANQLAPDLPGHSMKNPNLWENPEEQAQSTSPPSSRFSLTLMASPDISAFRINEINGLGTNVGIYLEYFLTGNLSLVSGAIYGNKVYRTSTTTGYSSYYPSSSRFWDGECHVLDIPLNIRYYAFDRPKDRWYLSGGISSYFMLREQYALTTESGGQVQTQQIDISNQNRHLFGIINLSIGYERQLHHKWALQIEPYFKLPVSGVGEGDINLKSTGVWIGLKHRW